ncbi:MAG: hypothetical protein H6733_08310 [Alphaproteobacteria bacterium]|nr:hypothetical protein [Alphaproteobacteria bacterium]
MRWGGIAGMALLASGCGMPLGAFDAAYAERYDAAVERCGGDPVEGARLEPRDGCTYDGTKAADCLDGLDAVNDADCGDPIDAPGTFDLPAACALVFTCAD